MKHAWLVVMMLAGTARGSGYCTCGEPMVLAERGSIKLSGTQYATDELAVIFTPTLDGAKWESHALDTPTAGRWHRHWWYAYGIRLYCAAGHNWFVEDKGVPPRACNLTYNTATIYIHSGNWPRTPTWSIPESALPTEQPVYLKHTWSTTYDTGIGVAGHAYR